MGRGGYEITPDDREDDGPYGSRGGRLATTEAESSAPVSTGVQDGNTLDAGQYAEATALSTGWGW